jgi:hypothetical protein
MKLKGGGRETMRSNIFQLQVTDMLSCFTVQKVPN